MSKYENCSEVLSRKLFIVFEILLIDDEKYHSKESKMMFNFFLPATIIISVIHTLKQK